jgi:hypothetical protein
MLLKRFKNLTPPHDLAAYHYLEAASVLAEKCSPVKPALSLSIFGVYLIVRAKKESWPDGTEFVEYLQIPPTAQTRRP